MKIRWPKIRIDLGEPVKDLERFIRQMGLTKQAGEDIDEQLAEQLASGNLLPWQLEAVSRIASRAAVLKKQKERGL